MSRWPGLVFDQAPENSVAVALFEDRCIDLLALHGAMVTETIEDGVRTYGLDPDVVVARLNECQVWPVTPAEDSNP